jgi:hypothetical protein
MGGEPGFLHRLDDLPRPLLGLGKAGEQHVHFLMGMLSRLLERLRARVELAAFLREILRNPSQPVRRFVAERHQLAGFVADLAVLLFQPLADRGQHAIELEGVGAERACRAREPLAAADRIFPARGAAEQQPGQAEQGQRPARQRQPLHRSGHRLAAAIHQRRISRDGEPARRQSKQHRPQGPAARRRLLMRRPAPGQIRRLSPVQGCGRPWPLFRPVHADTRLLRFGALYHHTHGHIFTMFGSAGKAATAP